MIDYRKYFEKIINTNNKFIKNFCKKISIEIINNHFDFFNII